ncbi:armadillo beta-catenin family repeat-containing protein [Cystoisospora suis]|uniref:Vacuolar protein 8 n=1 Tax=Cystoisospora suis TaxID=483139 RepID=A0A2C6L8S9_9APIC|nr:armadillo beta-catenin family repeat-containing protein [Cystoisospora suis]
MAASSEAGESNNLLPQLPGEVARSEQGKWEDKGEATLFKHSRPLTRLRLFMPSIIEETEEDIARQEEDDENEEFARAAASVAVEDDHEDLFDPNFLRTITETNPIDDESKEDPEFRQDFGDILKLLQTKLKQEDKFNKHIATQIASLRIKEKVMLLKYIRHVVLNSDVSITEFMEQEGFSTLLNVCLQNDEMLEHLPGIVVAVRYLKSPLRYLADEGAVGLMIKLSRKADHGVASRAAVAQACLVSFSKEEDNQYLDSWVECLLDITAGAVPTAQIFGSATLCQMTAELSLQSRLFRKTGIAAVLQLFKPESVPEALLWESSTIANLAQNPTYFPEFLQAAALDVLHLESNTIWNEVRLNAAWTFVFLTLQKAFHKQALGRWGAWVRDVLIIGICAEDSMTRNVTQLFFANITSKQTSQNYEAPIVRKYLQSLHMADDIVREQAQTFLSNLASTYPKETVEALLVLCSLMDDEEIPRDALSTLAALLSDPDTYELAVAHDAFLPFICLAARPDEEIQFLCARLLVKLISAQNTFLQYEDLEPVSSLLFLCDSKSDRVQQSAFNGLWVAMEMGLRNPDVYAIPVLRCCREEEPGATLHVSYRESVKLANAAFSRHRSKSAPPPEQLFGLQCLCAVLRDASAAVQGRCAYKIEAFSLDASALASMDDLCTRALAYCLVALGRSVVDSVKSSVVTAFTRVVASRTRRRASVTSAAAARRSSVAAIFSECRPEKEKTSASCPQTGHRFSQARLPLDHFLADNYTQCLCGILLDGSASTQLKQQCLSTMRESLNDPLVCQYLGKTDLMSRLFSAELARSAGDPTDFYLLYCRILSHPATLGHVSNYMGILEQLLGDVKNYPALALPLAQLLDAACFLPHIQGQRFEEQSVIPRPLLLDLLDLLGRYSGPSAAGSASPGTVLSDPGKTDATQTPEEAPTEQQPESAEGGAFRFLLEDDESEFGEGLDNRELLKCVVEALISLYRLGVLKDVFDREAMEKQFLPLFAATPTSDSSTVSLLSLANCLCIEPELLHCFLATPILADIAASIVEDGVQNEDLYIQTAELLRVALLHDDAQDEVVADLSIVDCIFKITKTPAYPQAQTRALFALHSILTNEKILRTMAADDFVPTLCEIALKGGSKDVQRVAAGVLSTVVVRPECREVVFTPTSLRDVLGVVLHSSMPEVYTQVLWAISYLPLSDEFVQPLLDNRVIERMKQIVTEDHVGVQTQARATIVQLSASVRLRKRFIELGFLPLLMSRTSTRDLSCCEASIHAMRVLSDSPMLAATLLDLGVEVKLQEVFDKCLQPQSKRGQSQQRFPGESTAASFETRVGEGPLYPSRESTQDVSRELEAARSASLELLCQLSHHAVQDQLALFDDATIAAVFDCLSKTRIRAVEEKRSAAMLFRLWTGVARTRRLLLAHNGLDVLLQLIISSEDAVVVEQLAWCMGNMAHHESSLDVETQMAEAGAIDALLYYSNSRHEEVRNRAQWALGTLSEETLRYNTLLAERSSEAVGLSEINRKHRELIRKKWTVGQNSTGVSRQKPGAWVHQAAVNGGGTLPEDQVTLGGLEGDRMTVGNVENHRNQANSDCIQGGARSSALPDPVR